MAFSEGDQHALVKILNRGRYFLTIDWVSLTIFEVLNFFIIKMNEKSNFKLFLSLKGNPPKIVRVNYVRIVGKLVLRRSIIQR